jgi:transposase
VTAVDYEAHLSQLREKLDTLAAEREHLAAEREHFRKLYLDMLEVCRKLELGIVGPKRERMPENDAQLTMAMLGMLLEGAGRGTAPPTPPAQTEIAAHMSVRAFSEGRSIT